MGGRLSVNLRDGLRSSTESGRIIAISPETFKATGVARLKSLQLTEFFSLQCEKGIASCFPYMQRCWLTVFPEPLPPPCNARRSLSGGLLDRKDKKALGSFMHANPRARPLYDGTYFRIEQQDHGCDVKQPECESL